MFIKYAALIKIKTHLTLARIKRLWHIPKIYVFLIDQWKMI